MAPAVFVGERVLDPLREPGLRDHCPTWTFPVLSLAGLADLAADWCEELAGRPLNGLSDLRPAGWITFATGPRRLRATLRALEAGGLALAVDGLDGVDAALSPWRPLAAATLWTEPRARARWRPAPLRGAQAQPDPYAAGELFHGPSLQVLGRQWIGDDGADVELVGSAAHATSRLRQDLLDGVAQAVPAAALARWGAAVEPGQAAFPIRLAELDLRGPVPRTSDARAELRWLGFDGGDRRHPRVRAQLQADGAVFMELELVFRLLPLGPLGALSARERRDFCRDRRAVPGAGLSRAAGAQTRLDPRELARCDWLPGTVAALYGLPPGPVDPRGVVARDHVARRCGLHPSAVRLAADGGLGAEERLRRSPHGTGDGFIPAPEPDGVTASTPGGEQRLVIRREGREWIAEDAS
ncbi:MAG: polyketide synthase dehydratase domain-containing protein [Vicinamibacteria bacterium]|nr:polyketide synthase dehydratase domain-containing protein [Vicinamibacteria bacterium]